MSHTTSAEKRQRVSANLTAEIEKEISHIKRENENIFRNLVVLEKEEIAVVKSKSDSIRALEKNYVRLHELGEYTKPVTHICADICWILRDKKLWGSEQLARRIIAEEHKQTEFTSHNNLPGMRDENTDTNYSVPEPAITGIPEDNVMNSYGSYDGENNISPYSTFNPPQFDQNNTTQPQIAIPEKPLDQLPDDEARQYAEALTARERKSREALLEDRRRAREARDYCELHKIPLSPEFDTTHEPHISAQSPDSGPSVAWEACIELRDTFDKLADKLYRWRPPKRLAEDLKLAFEEEIEFYKTFVDEKYRECQPAWWVVQCNNIMHGKHAAAIMAATPIDEKTKRALTREQVGDRQLEDHLRAVRFVAAQKAKVKCWWWFHEMNRKGIARRAKELNPVLSEKSFT